MLEVRDLSLAYERAGSAVQVTRGVSFDGAPGDLIGVVGPNGTGKTTLLRAIAGFMRPQSGTIKLDPSATVTYISQNFRAGFFSWASLQTNLALNAGGVFPVGKEQKEKIGKIATDLGIDIDLSIRPQQASGGMLQQVNIVLAELRGRGIILADEPFAALDIEVAGRLRRAFRKSVKTSKSTAVLVLHNPDEILEVCDRVLLIPQMPFSTATGEAANLAEIVEIRRSAASEDQVHGANSFMQAMKRLLGVQ